MKEHKIVYFTRKANIYKETPDSTFGQMPYTRKECYTMLKLELNWGLSVSSK